MSSPARPPRFAYLMLTHKDSASVEELANRIQELSPDALIVVHHDAAAADVPWGGRPPDHIDLVEPVHVTWGDWSMIEASMRLLRYAVEHTDADWFVLLSGEHRPAVDLRSWEAAAAGSGKDAFLGAEQLPDHLRLGAADLERNKYLARSRHRWRLVARPRRASVHRLMGLLMKLSTRLRPLVSMEFVHRRDAWAVGWRRSAGPARAWSIFRGSQWFALNRRAATAALAIDPAVAEWFRQSWIPDEAYLHTALRQVPRLAIADALTTFVPDEPEKPYPGWIKLAPEDLPAVWKSGLPFARKVDLAGRPEVVSRIDRAVDRQRAGQHGDPEAVGPHNGEE